MAIILRGKIVLVRRNIDGGPLYESVFLLKGSDLASPAWTRNAHHAEIYPWPDAQRIAASLNGHAVVVQGADHPPAPVAPVPKPIERPRPARPLRGRFGRPVRGELRVSQINSELERRKLF